MIWDLRNGQRSFSESAMHAIETAPADWEKGYCDLCCLLLNKAFLLECGHTFCDRCIVVLVEGNRSISPDTVECPFCLTISPHLISRDSKTAPEPPAPSFVSCQAPNHKLVGTSSVQYFCVQTSELICTSCASSALYVGKALLTVTEAAEYFGNIIHDKTTNIRLAVAEVRKYVRKLRRQQDSLGLQLEEMIENLNNRKLEIINAVTEKFSILERILIRFTDMHRDELARETTDITQRVRSVMDAVSSSEKHAAQQDPLVFLVEAKMLISLLSQKLKALSSCTERRAAPPPLQLPQLGSTANILGAVRALEFRDLRGKGLQPSWGSKQS